MKTATLMTVRILAIIALALTAFVHLRLAHTYDPVGKGHFITQGRLFRLQGVVSILAALALAVSNRLEVWAVALLTAGASLAAILVYRYVNVGAIGPIPNMYEPTWQSIKVAGIMLKPLAVVADAVAAGAALVGLGSRFAS